MYTKPGVPQLCARVGSQHTNAEKIIINTQIKRVRFVAFSSYK